MLRIGEAAKRYGISNRTLRHWEDVGILKSTRAENGYRYYNDDNEARIRQIVLLRKLKMPISDIEQLFIANHFDVATEILSNYLMSVKHNMAIHHALAMVIEKLLENIKQSQSIEAMFLHLETQNVNITAQQMHACTSSDDAKAAQEHVPAPFDHAMNEPVTSAENTCETFPTNHTERMIAVDELKNVRIIDLPPMTVASYCVQSETPEIDCAKVFDAFVLENNLNKRGGHRSFGFNNPDPSEDSAVYGYELWVTIPEDFELPIPFGKKQFDGGLYASISAQMNEIGERWASLCTWSTHNERYEGDFARQWLEEQVMDYETFMSEHVPESEKQLDLLLPIKLKNEES